MPCWDLKCEKLHRSFLRSHQGIDLTRLLHPWCSGSMKRDKSDERKASTLLTSCIPILLARLAVGVQLTISLEVRETTVPPLQHSIALQVVKNGFKRRKTAIPPGSGASGMFQNLLTETFLLASLQKNLTMFSVSSCQRKIRVWIQPTSSLCNELLTKYTTEANQGLSTCIGFMRPSSTRYYQWTKQASDLGDQLTLLKQDIEDFFAT